MGYQMEMNWYLVLKQEAIYHVEDGIPVDTETIAVTETFHSTMKDGVRIYPIDAVVPIILDNKAIGLAHIKETSHFKLNNEFKTTIGYDYILKFEDQDPIANHYTDMYLAYKKKQQIEDHGGKFKLQDWTNALERRSLEKALEEIK